MINIFIILNFFDVFLDHFVCTLWKFFKIFKLNFMKTVSQIDENSIENTIIWKFLLIYLF